MYIILFDNFHCTEPIIKHEDKLAMRRNTIECKPMKRNAHSKCRIIEHLNTNFILTKFHRRNYWYYVVSLIRYVQYS